MTIVKIAPTISASQLRFEFIAHQEGPVLVSVLDPKGHFFMLFSWLLRPGLNITALQNLFVIGEGVYRVKVIDKTLEVVCESTIVKNLE